MYFYSKQPVDTNKPSFPSKMSKEPASQVDAFHVGTHCQLKTCNVLPISAQKVGALANCSDWTIYLGPAIDVN